MIITGKTDIRVDGTPICVPGTMNVDSIRMEIPPGYPGISSKFVSGCSISEPEIKLYEGISLHWPDTTLKFTSVSEFYRFANWVQEARDRYDYMARCAELGIDLSKEE
jgi:hypothetical protein